MLAQYFLDQGQLIQDFVNEETSGALSQAIWVDLVSPTEAECNLVHKNTGALIPTPEDMLEIEASSRLYIEGASLVMVLPVLNKAAGVEPNTVAIAFILINHRLVTVRYADPMPFSLFATRLKQEPALMNTGEKMMLGLLEQIADRLADILEGAIAEMDLLSNSIFRSQGPEEETHVDHLDVLQRVGRVSDLTTRAKDSLLGLSRTAAFFAAHSSIDRDEKERFETLQHDIASLDDHTKFLSERVGFLLNATLGMVNIDQNNIIKIFSVVAVAFLPPTLIASIYGMNFEGMPELKWALGYPFVLLLMLFSVLIPFYYFRRKRWL